MYILQSPFRASLLALQGVLCKCVRIIRNNSKKLLSRKIDIDSPKKILKLEIRYSIKLFKKSSEGYVGHVINIYQPKLRGPSHL